MDLAVLNETLKVLKKYNISRFKDEKAGLEVEFNHHPAKSPASTPPPAAGKPKEADQPILIDLKADDLMSEDDILFHSSPDHDPKLPLTGDKDGSKA